MLERVVLGTYQPWVIAALHAPDHCHVDVSDHGVHITEVQAQHSVASTDSQRVEAGISCLLRWLIMVLTIHLYD
jgi:hypothetical protein